MTTRPLNIDDLYRLTLVGDAQISPDGSRIAYVVKLLDREQNDYMSNIYLWEAGESRQFTSGGKDSAPRWSPDGEYLAFASDRNEEWDLRSASDIWIVSREGGGPRRVTDGQGMWNSPAFSPDGSHIAFVGYAKPENGVSTYFPQLWTISRGGGEATNLLAATDLAAGHSLLADWSIAGGDGLFWEEAGIYLIISERGTANVYRWQDSLQPVTEGRHDVMDFSVCRGQVACTIADATHPAEIGLVKDGWVETVTGHNRDVMAEAAAIEPEHLTFTGTEGAEVDGWLMRPAGYIEGQTYPLIVYIHGGPATAYGETFFHEFQALAGQGYGVFYSNPHGSTSSGQRFLTSIRGDWGNLDYQDLMIGVDRMLQERWVDPNRLGVAGGSYGGFMTNWIIGHTDRFAAACTQRSICNMVSQGGISDWAATRGEALGTTPEGNPERLWNMSPLKYASNVKTPTLIIHSERDDRCPIAQGEEWYMALRRQRVPTRFVRFPEESHGLSRGGKPSRRAERMQHIQDWFSTYL